MFIPAPLSASSSCLQFSCAEVNVIQGSQNSPSCLGLGTVKRYHFGIAKKQKQGTTGIERNLEFWKTGTKQISFEAS